MFLTNNIISLMATLVLALDIRETTQIVSFYVDNTCLTSKLVSKKGLYAFSRFSSRKIRYFLVIYILFTFQGNKSALKWKYLLFNQKPTHSAFQNWF